MERNDANDFANDFGTAGSTGSASTGGTSGAGSGAGGLGAGGSTGGYGGGSGLGGSMDGTAGYADSAGGSYGGTTATSTSPTLDAEAESRTDQLRDTAKDQAAAAREKLGQAGERAKDMKRNVEQTLADKLEAGANRLRQRGTSGASGAGTSTPAYAAAGGATAAPIATDARMDDLQGNVAKGMEATADWLRNGDLKSTVEEQARTNPGRTLLVALGVGYLLGKAIRR